MTASNLKPGFQGVLARPDLALLFQELKRSGYAVIGPTIRDQAIVYEELDSDADLPIGWTEVQNAGHYRIQKRDDDAVFGFTVGPDSWKKFLQRRI